MGLKDGTIDVIASDHAPHTTEEKNIEFALAANGIVGLETTLGLVISELVDSNVLSLRDAISKMTINPAKILGIDKGYLKAGCDADITVFDASKEWTVDINNFFSKSKNSPFHEWKLKGQVVCTIVKGKIVFRDGKMI
jgi:dihydroorotase